MIRAGIAIASMLAIAGCSSGSTTPMPKMVDIAGGSFTMGASPESDAQQGKPQHRVRLSAFRIADTPVTFDQYDVFAIATKRALPQDDGLGRGNRPVINLDRADMLAYLDWLTAQGGAGRYRLPSEAEWEYAARAGTTTGFYWGDDPDPGMANTRTNGGLDTFKLTSPVKTFPANPWGLYDMAGNVWEMTADCRYPDYVGTPVDGSARTGPDCFSHIVRGGDYSSSKRGQRPTARSAAGDQFRSTSLGFRVAQDIMR
ncbi:MAG: formylglycine-generating enzyme family protein [Sphingomonas sp.]